jgi:hypothetical protein
VGKSNLRRGWLGRGVKGVGVVLVVDRGMNYLVEA